MKKQILISAITLSTVFSAFAMLENGTTSRPPMYEGMMGSGTPPMHRGMMGSSTARMATDTLIIIGDPKHRVDNTRHEVDMTMPKDANNMPKPPMRRDMPCDVRPERDNDRDMSASNTMPRPPMRGGAMGSDTPMRHPVPCDVRPQRDNDRDMSRPTMHEDMAGSGTPMMTGMHEGMMSSGTPMNVSKKEIGDRMMNKCISLDANISFGDGRKSGRENMIKNLQSGLIDSGYMSGSSTGYFGSSTRDAIKKYQKDMGLPTTGYIGAMTRNKMKKGCTPMPLPVASTTAPAI